MLSAAPDPGVSSKEMQHSCAAQVMLGSHHKPNGSTGDGDPESTTKCITSFENPPGIEEFVK